VRERFGLEKETVGCGGGAESSAYAFSCQSFFIYSYIHIVCVRARARTYVCVQRVAQDRERGDLDLRGTDVNVDTTVVSLALVGPLVDQHGEAQGVDHALLPFARLPREGSHYGVADDCFWFYSGRQGVAVPELLGVAQARLRCEDRAVWHAGVLVRVERQVVVAVKLVAIPVSLPQVLGPGRDAILSHYTAWRAARAEGPNAPALIPAPGSRDVELYARPDDGRDALALVA